MMDSGKQEQSNTYPALPGFDPCLLPAFGARYVTQDVQLAFTTLTPLNGNLNVQVCARMLLDDGRITEFETDLVVPNNTQPQTKFIPLTKGYLLAASATMQGSGILHGGLFASLSLVYARGASQSISEILAQGYMNDVGGISFPYGKNEQPGDGAPDIEVIPANAPAAGVNWTFTPPLGYLLRMAALRLTLVTSAAVANRLVRIKMASRGAAGVLEVIAPAVQAASTTNEYNFFIGGSPLAVGTVQQAGLPHSYNLLEGSAWATDVQNLQAADQISVLGGWYEGWVQVWS